MRKKRKNFLPTLILILVLWVSLGGLIYYVDPELVKDMVVPGLYLPFFLMFFPASFLTLAAVFTNSRRGLLGAMMITGFLVLRIYKLGNFLNFLLLLAIAVAVDRYFEV